MTQHAIDEARRIYMDLRPSILDDLGILATISWFLRQFETIYSTIRIEREVDLDEEDVPEPLKIVIFRIMQEALNNVAKYSKADRVSLSFVKSDGRIDLTIRDNGKGFDLTTATARKDQSGGMGLTSMRERTHFSGGSFAIKSHIGEGTTIRASWPVT
jgi:signal transduction histidine kinase